MTRQFALFDLDDTLVDTSGAYARSAAEFTEHHRLPADSIDWLLLAPEIHPDTSALDTQDAIDLLLSA